MAATAMTLTLVACAQTDAAWDEAKALDTPDGYASYQEHHPRSTHSDEARVRREALIAERDWSAARNTDTIDGYREYLDKHPEGLWAGRAKERAAALSPAEAAAVPTEPAIIEEKVAPVAKQPTTAAPQIYVQLGAFSTAQGAEKAWRELQARHAALRTLQPTYRRSRSGSGGLHLLKAGVASQADAEALCRQLQAAGQACLIS